MTLACRHLRTASHAGCVCRYNSNRKLTDHLRTTSGTTHYPSHTRLTCSGNIKNAGSLDPNQIVLVELPSLYIQYKIRIVTVSLSLTNALPSELECIRWILTPRAASKIHYSSDRTLKVTCYVAYNSIYGISRWTTSCTG